MKLDKPRILSLFAMLTDIPEQELGNWDALCLSAGTWIMDHIRENVNIKREMERLCMAAAACAYYDYAMLSGAANGSGDEVRIGDISLKNTGGCASSVRDHFLASVSDLLYLPAGFAFCATGASL